MLPEIKIALVHDWLTGMRGGEKVLEILCELYPQADLFTLLHNSGSVSPTIESRQIFTSYINRLPFKKKNYRSYLPLFPSAIEKFNLKGYDLIISSSHCVAKGIRTPPDSLHIAYLHTPMRYVWDMYDDYFGEENTGWFLRKIIPLIANYLRMWDVTSSIRCDWFLANSVHVAKRIKKYYGRSATVIYPPVDTSIFSSIKNVGTYYLVVSALVPYKRVDLAVRVFNQIKKPLVIVGEGPEKNKLKKLSGSTISFVDWQPPHKLKEYYGNCKALIFPGEEDFGIVPVEAMACGKPIIAFGKGGALETVLGIQENLDSQSTGIFFHQQTEEALINAIQHSETIAWNTDFIERHAEKFNTDNFKQKIKQFVEKKYSNFKADLFQI
jgi:glycosyltransferase involved in cell wall biosynthesis